MPKIAALCFGLLLATPALAQQTQYFEYTCTLVDGARIGADGALVRDASTQEYIQRQSPLTFNTVTARMRRAAAPPSIFETFNILDHGSAIAGLEAYDTTIGLGGVLHIRVDLPGPPYRFLLQGSGTTFSGTCERTPL